MKIFFTLTISYCFCAPVLNAQKNNEQDDSTFKEIRLNEIVISANKAPEKRKNIAQQVIVLSGKKMEFLNQVTSATLLEQSGNVFVQKSQGGGGSPVIRGFEANKVLIVIDGVRMNNAIFRGGHLQNVITMDNAILDKTEVLFGPASVVFGSDALGGVISFYTKKPTLSTTKNKLATSGNIFVRYSSAYSEKAIHADISAGSHKIGLLTSVTYSDFNHLRQGKNYYTYYPDWGKRFLYTNRMNGKDSMLSNNNSAVQNPTGYSQYDFLQKVLIKAGENGEHILNFQYSISSDIPRYDRLTETDSTGRFINAQWYYGPQKRLMAAYNFSLLSKSVLFNNATITVAYQNIEESRHNRRFNSEKLNHRIENVKVYSFNTDFNKLFSKNEYRYGAELIANKVNSKAYLLNIISGTVSPLDTRYPSGGSNTKSYALYATHTKKISPLVVLNDGLRLTYSTLFSKFNDKSFFDFPYDEVGQHSAAITGNIGLIISSKDGWRIAPLFSTGFRTPNVDDVSKVFESAGGNLIVPNPDLKPEHTYNYELSISKTLNNKFQLGLTAYYSNYKNALTTERSTFKGKSHIQYEGVLSPVSTIVNKARAYICGFSGNIAADITKHFSFLSVLNYTYGRFKESPKNYPLDHVPPVYGKTSVNAHFTKFTGEIFVLYNGSKKNKDYNLRGEDNQLYSADPVNGFTPSWTTINFRSQYQVNKYFRIQFAMENITDKFYRVFASGLSAPGRNIVLTLRAKL